MANNWSSAIKMMVDSRYNELLQIQIEYASALRAIATGEELSGSAEHRLQLNEQSDGTPQKPPQKREVVLKQRIAFLQSRIKSTENEISEVRMQQRRLSTIISTVYYM